MLERYVRLVDMKCKKNMTEWDQNGENNKRKLSVNYYEKIWDKRKWSVCLHEISEYGDNKKYEINGRVEVEIVNLVDRETGICKSSWERNCKISENKAELWH